MLCKKFVLALALVSAVHAEPTRLCVGAPRHCYALPGRPAEPSAADDLDGRLSTEVRDGQTVIRVKLAPGEAIWGAGQRLDAFNLRGRAFDIWAEDGWNRWDTAYFAVPWFVSSDGYAIFINSTGRLLADIGATDVDTMTVTVPEAGAEIWVFRGGPRQIVAHYTALVGRPHPLPDWALKPWLSRNSFLGAYEINRTLREGARQGFRFGAVVLEAWAEHLHNFRFEERRYPNPARWIRELKRQGVHVVCWITPSVWTSSAAYAEARTNGWIVLNDDGSEYVTRWLENGRKIDFRHPGARAWWRDLHRPLIRMGVAGFKTDGGEHMPDPWFHNEHPYHYQRATLDAFAAEGVPGLAFARSGNPLTAGNSAFWGGDQHAAWSNLAAVVRAGLSAAWSGHFYWSHDVGGYTGEPSPELYTRWLQLGVFSPIVQLHGIGPREPWRFGAEARAIARGYFRARERLLPTLRRLAEEARTEGLPMWRPLPMQFPEDPDAREIGDQFMLGDELLVAPVLDAANRRQIYLPAGEWVDLWTREMIAGPARFDAEFSLARTPVYARAEHAARWRDLLADVPRKPIRPDDPPPASMPVAQRWMALGWLPGGVGSLQPLDGVRAHTNQMAVGTDGQPRTWRMVEADAHGRIDLGPGLGREGFSTAYLYTEIPSRTRQHVRFLLGSGDALRVWHNEKLLFAREAHRNPDRDEDAVDLTLTPGENRILLRVSRDLAEPVVFFRAIAR